MQVPPPGHISPVLHSALFESAARHAKQHRKHSSTDGRAPAERGGRQGHSLGTKARRRCALPLDSRQHNRGLTFDAFAHAILAGLGGRAVCAWGRGAGTRGNVGRAAGVLCMQMWHSQEAAQVVASAAARLQSTANPQPPNHAHSLVGLQGGAGEQVQSSLHLPPSHCSSVLHSAPFRPAAQRRQHSAARTVG